MKNIEKVNIISSVNRFKRFLWNTIYLLMFRPFPSKFFRRWRNFILRIFGAKIHSKAGVYATASIWAPWNLILEENAWIGPYVRCYNVALIQLNKNATVSQGSHLCSASHDIFSVKHELITAPILIESDSWVAVDTYVHMGVTIGQGAVVGANACVYKDVEPWTIVGGNPAKFIKKRILKNE
jgi:putative colanic acid biosynthesis acetyltransferase WcaF